MSPAVHDAGKVQRSGSVPVVVQTGAEKQKMPAKFVSLLSGG